MRVLYGNVLMFRSCWQHSRRAARRYMFFDKNNMLCRLDSNTDISEIYDEVGKAVSARQQICEKVLLVSIVTEAIIQ